MSDKIQSIPISQLIESKNNPRKKETQEQLTDLVLSIREKGIIQPLIVRFIQVIKGGAQAYEIVAGHRRYWAALEINLDEVPVIVKEISDSEVLEYQMIENLQREDLPPMLAAKGFETMLKRDKSGDAVKNVAAAIGKDPSFVARRLQLLRLHPQFQKLLEKSLLPISHAEELCRLSDDDQKRLHQKLYNQEDRHPSLDQIKKLIKRDFLPRLGEAGFDKDDASLVPKAGACTGCKYRVGNQPHLFSDVKEADCCSNMSCFIAKIKAYKQRLTEEEAAGQHRRVVWVCRHYSWEETKLFGLKQEPPNLSYADEIKPYTGDISTAPGLAIYIDEPMGKVIGIRFPKEEKKEGGSESVPGSKLSKSELIQRTERRKETNDTRIRQEFQRVSFKQLLSAIKYPLKREDLELIAVKLAEHARNNDDIIAEGLGYKQNKDGFYDFELGNDDGEFARLIKKLPDNELARTAMAIVLSDEMIRDPSRTYDKEDDPGLVQALKRYKVDTAPIEKQARELFAKQSDRINERLKELKKPAPKQPGKPDKKKKTGKAKK